jgi:hypothetical protein
VTLISINDWFWGWVRVNLTGTMVTYPGRLTTILVCDEICFGEVSVNQMLMRGLFTKQFGLVY